MSPRTPRKEPPEICPVCGEDLPRHAHACPECGADYRSGWKEDAARYDALDLPGEEFDYQEFAQEEFGSVSPVIRSQHWWIVAAIVFIVLLAMMLSLFR